MADDFKFETSLTPDMISKFNARACLKNILNCLF